MRFSFGLKKSQKRKSSRKHPEALELMAGLEPATC
jgi:hypothetical protein